MAARPIKLEDIDVSKISLKSIEKKDGKAATGQMYLINYDGDKRLRLLTPEMVAPWGPGVHPDFPDTKVKMSLSFENDGGSVLDGALDKLRLIQDTLREKFPYATHFKDGEKTKREILQARFHTFIKQDDKKKRADRFDVTFQPHLITDAEYKGLTTAEERKEYLAEFRSLPGYPLLMNKEQTPIVVTKSNYAQAIPGGSRLKAVLEGHLWATKDKINVVWSFKHGALLSVKRRSTFNIVTEEEDEHVAGGEQEAVHEEDDDEEEEEDDEEEEQMVA